MFLSSLNNYVNILLYEKFYISCQFAVKLLMEIIFNDGLKSQEYMVWIIKVSFGYIYLMMGWKLRSAWCG